MYTKYGSNNETAQKQFYELERDAVVKAFFTVSMYKQCIESTFSLVCIASGLHASGRSQ